MENLVSAGGIGNSLQHQQGANNFWWVPLAAAGVSAAGNFFGNQQANEANAEQAALNRIHNAREANITREWQEKMRRTTYQDTVSDMKAAGLNPMLAIDKGGSATPSGAQSHGVNTHEMKNMWGPMVSGAMEGLRLITELKNADSMRALQGAQAVAQLQDAKSKAVSAERDKALTGLTIQQGLALTERMASIREGAKRDEAQARIDQKFMEYDSYARRALELSGGISDAVGAFGLGRLLGRGRSGGGKSPAPGRGDKQYSLDDMLDAARGKGVSVP